MTIRRTRAEARAAGPITDFGKWRETRTRQIQKPRRNKAALKLGAPKKPEGAA